MDTIGTGSPWARATTARTSDAMLHRSSTRVAGGAVHPGRRPMAAALLDDVHVGHRNRAAMGRAGPPDSDQVSMAARSSASRSRSSEYHTHFPRLSPRTSPASLRILR